jgi:hypothetical protein
MSGANPPSTNLILERDDIDPARAAGLALDQRRLSNTPPLSPSPTAGTNGRPGTRDQGNASTGAEGDWQSGQSGIPGTRATPAAPARKAHRK